MPRTYLVIPTAAQALELVAGAHHAHNQLPPAGMTLGIDPRVEWLATADGWLQTHTPLFVDGVPPDGTEEDWYWGTLGEALAATLIDGSEPYNWLVEKLVSLTSKTVSAVLALPLLKKGKANTTMRWLRVTYQGTLGGVEMFQHKIDLSKAGADPDPNEAACAALAETFAGSWKSAFLEYQQNVTSPEVKYTQVGVAKITQTDASDASGDGGNPEYAFPTQWFAYPLADQPVGVSPTASLPYEVACAVTTLTDHRGPSGRGRFYLPPFSASALASLGRFSSGALTALGTALGHHMDDLRDGGDFYPVVVSGRRLIHNEIKQLLIGVVPDSQRRRRKSQDEARLTAWTAA